MRRNWLDIWLTVLSCQSWGLQASHLFSLEEKPPRCKEYVEEKVFAIDFDEKAVRVARTLNLIAGDGQTNVLHLNTLDYELWDEITKQEEWDDIYHTGFRRLKKRRPKGNKDYREFQFDVLMANPPFAGDIKEHRMIARYELAKKPNGKQYNKIGRDILFIERNLDFLKPGGRMAIVLPQGRFNNSSDKNIREFIAERCRILAVVGLHGNTFKPHTGTKTSVLLVQKWNDDPKIGALCPRQDDYNIFFATMRKSGKDNSGEKIYVKKGDDSPDFLLDNHKHWIVDHDLYNHEGLTEDGIAEAFIEFAKKENLSFFEIPPANATLLFKGGRGGSFDALKYQGLMDRLEAVELALSEALKNKDFRIDSEFHRKPPVQNPNYSYVDVGDNLTFIQYGISIEMNEEGEGTKIYRMNEIHNMFCDVEISKFADIPSVDIEAFKLKDRDVLFNRTNSFHFVGRTGLFKSFSDEDLVFASYLIRVRTDKSKILPEYLVAFLNSRLGIWDVKRRARISINQSNVNAQELAAVKIPLLSPKFQTKLQKLFDQAHFDRLSSISLYQQAEELLLSELGLNDWQPPEETITVKSFSDSFLSSGRFDAEYYQPKYDEFYKCLETSCLDKKWKIKRLKDLSSCFKYGSSDSLEYISQGVPFLRIADLQKYRFNKKDLKFISQESANKQQAKVKTDDVLISRSGTLGLAIVIPEYLNNAIYGSYFILTRPDNTLILSTYLALYINSLVGKLQTEQANTGGIQTNLTIPVLESLLIACPPLNIQQKFVDKINQCYDAEDKAKQLLEIAKIGVEKAIETDEETATNWINEQLETMEITTL